MRFGTYSVLLTVGALNGAILTALLWRTGTLAMRPLAVLVGLVSLRLTPYILGFAGAYDLHPWLTFAPFDLSLAFGPLTWAYVTALSNGRLPAHGRRHAIPAALQFTYQLCCFLLPNPVKWEWYTGAHLALIEPVGYGLALLSLSFYLWLASRQFDAWQRWMDDHLSNREAYRLGSVRVVLLAMGATVVAGVLTGVISLVSGGLDYFGRFPLVALLAGLSYVLGLAGWRQSSLGLPVIASQASLPEVDERAGPLAGQRVGRPRADYQTLAEEWRAQLRSEQWYRETDLTLAVLAERLHTSPRTVSRVLAEGTTSSFNAFINRIRVEAVQTALKNPGETRDLLSIALDAGFSSKASFNRAYRAATGESPSSFRARESARHAAREP